MMLVAQETDVLLMLQAKQETLLTSRAKGRRLAKTRQCMKADRKKACVTLAVPNISYFTWPPPNSFFNVARVAA